MNLLRLPAAVLSSAGRHGALLARRLGVCRLAVPPLSAVIGELIVPTVLGTFSHARHGRSLPRLYADPANAAPGLMSSPALAALLRLDITRTFARLIACTAITPLRACLRAAWRWPVLPCPIRRLHN